MMPILQLGPLALPLPPLLLLLGVWIGLSLAEKRAARHGISPDRLFNLSLAGLLAGVIGARLAYVARYPAAFAQNPWDILSRNPGLLDPWGGLVIGTLAAAIYAQRKKMPLWPTLDALTPALSVLLLASAAATLASGEAYGAPSTLPWSIDMWGASRHPTQIYALLAAALIFWLLWSGKLLAFPPGAHFLSFAALASASRLFLETFRGDSILLPGGWRAAQLVSWIILAASLYALIWLRLKAYTPPEEEI
ncbi:MAG: prolipoprotein diacylglyceryl transferase [Chloroflexi bacterium]|nr:prolipoprotein diacylglyceryl transferase [Chloroflexota bacterium]